MQAGALSAKNWCTRRGAEWNDIFIAGCCHSIIHWMSGLRTCCDATFNNQILCPADQHQMFNIVTAHQHQAACLINLTKLIDTETRAPATTCAATQAPKEGGYQQQYHQHSQCHGDVEHIRSVSYTHLRAHETGRNLVCRLL